MIWRLLMLFLLWTVNCQKFEDHPYCCQNDQYTKIGDKQECVDEISNRTTPVNLEKCANNTILAISAESMESALRDQPITKKNVMDIGIDNYCLGHVQNESEVLFLFCTSEEIFDSDLAWLPYLLYISVFFLTLTTCIYLVLPRLLDTQGVCIVHLMVGLGLGFVFLASLQVYASYSQAACEILAFLTYGTFIYAFFWLNTLSFHIWRTTIEVRWLQIKIKWLYAYHVYAIGGSFLLILITLLAHVQEFEINPGFGDGRCWFRTLYEQFLFFYFPILILIVLNIIFFGWTMYHLWNQVDKKNTAVLFRTKMCLKLFVIMGIPWIFEIISATVIYYGRAEWDKYLIVLKAINALKGFLIFLILVILRKRVRRELARNKICGIQFPTQWRNLEDDEGDDFVADHTTVEFHNVTSDNKPNGEI